MLLLFVYRRVTANTGSRRRREKWPDCVLAARCFDSVISCAANADGNAKIARRSFLARNVIISARAHHHASSS